MSRDVRLPRHSAPASSPSARAPLPGDSVFSSRAWTEREGADGTGVAGAQVAQMRAREPHHYHSIANISTSKGAQPAASPSIQPAATPPTGEATRQADGAGGAEEALGGEQGVLSAGAAAGSQHAARNGLPPSLRLGVELLSGLALDDVRVHFNSSRPATVQALAYTRGEEIHVGPGQEAHLAHEAWHVVQQKQGRVAPTLQARGVTLNDDQALEREAEVMGGRAHRIGAVVMQRGAGAALGPTLRSLAAPAGGPIQRAVGFEFQTKWYLRRREHDGWQSLPRGTALFKDASGLLAGKPAKLDQGGKFNFLVESDDGNDGSEAELITAPFTEQPAMDLAATTMRVFEQALVETPSDAQHMRPLNVVSTKFESLVERTDDPRASAGAAPPKLRPSTRQTPDSASIAFGSPEKSNWLDDPTSRPQATFSVPLERFADVMSMFDVTLPAIGDGRNKGAAAQFQAALARARRVVATLDPAQDWSRLTGFLALVIGALWTSSSYFTPGIDYVKSSFPVMLRNDFHALYTKLQRYEQAIFQPDWLLGIIGMDGNAPMFPTGFKVEANDSAHFHPLRREWLLSIINPGAFNAQAHAGDEQVVTNNVRRADFTSDEEYEAAAAEERAGLQKKDLLSRGWVRASAYSMGAFKTPANREVRVEWRAFRPKELPMSQAGAAMTNVLNRLQHPGPPPAVPPYRQEHHERRTVTRHEFEDWGLKRTDKPHKVAKKLRHLDLQRELYRDREGKLWRLIDVISPGGEEGMNASDENIFEDYLATKVTPSYRFTFETVLRDDFIELRPEYNADQLSVATSAAGSGVGGGAPVGGAVAPATGEPHAPSHSSLASLLPGASVPPPAILPSHAPTSGGPPAPVVSVVIPAGANQKKRQQTAVASGALHEGIAPATQRSKVEDGALAMQEILLSPAELDSFFGEGAGAYIITHIERSGFSEERLSTPTHQTWSYVTMRGDKLLFRRPN